MTSQYIYDHRNIHTVTWLWFGLLRNWLALNNSCGIMQSHDHYFWPSQPTSNKQKSMGEARITQQLRNSLTGWSDSLKNCDKKDRKIGHNSLNKYLAQQQKLWSQLDPKLRTTHRDMESSINIPALISIYSSLASLHSPSIIKDLRGYIAERPLRNSLLWQAFRKQWAIMYGNCERELW